MLVREIDIIKIQKIVPSKRIIKLEMLYLLNITTLSKKIIHIGINQDASPKITNNKELKFEPKRPKAFKGGWSGCRQDIFHIRDCLQLITSADFDTRINRCEVL